MDSIYSFLLELVRICAPDFFAALASVAIAYIGYMFQHKRKRKRK